jgi:hypothetical protein
MKVFLLFLISFLMVSCSSIESIQKNPSCVVWRDQKIWGPASVEVTGKKVSWIGGCRGMHWDCKILKISVDEKNNVMSEEIPMGSIENNRFSFFPDHPFGNYVSSEFYTAIPNQMIVNSSNRSYHFTNKCEVSEAIIGAIAVDMIDHIQSEKLK